MNLKNVNKNYTIGLVVLALIVLIVVTVIQPGSLTYKDTNDYDQLYAKAEYERKQYEQLLAEVKPDYESSKDFMEKVISDDVVNLQIESDLRLSQKIVIPVVNDSELKITNRQDQDAVANYLNDVSSMVANYNEKIATNSSQVFNELTPPDIAIEGRAETLKLVQNLKSVSVPVDAVPMHKATIIAFQKHSELFNSAEKFAENEATTPWSDIYSQYYIIQQSSTVVKKQIAELTEKYALQDLTVPMASSMFIKTAQAGWPVIDIWNVVFRAIESALSQAFAQYFMKMTNNIFEHIEKNFAIASQLYYSNTLDRHYSEEFMKKYVEDPLDKLLIKEFLPSVFCKPKDDDLVKQIFIAKAKVNAAPNLEFDQSNPDWLQKMANLLSDPKNSTAYYDDYYNALSATTVGEAGKASNKEVTSDGLKAGRSDAQGGDIVGKTMQKTMSSLRSAQQTAYEKILELGSSNPQDFITTLLAAQIKKLTDKFVFTPIGGGQLEVYQESEKCLKIPKIKPIAPVPDSGYSTPPFQPYPSQTPLPTGNPNSASFR